MHFSVLPGFLIINVLQLCVNKGTNLNPDFAHKSVIQQWTHTFYNTYLQNII